MDGEGDVRRLGIMVGEVVVYTAPLDGGAAMVLTFCALVHRPRRRRWHPA